MRQSSSRGGADWTEDASPVRELIDVVASDDFQCGFAPSLYETLAVIAAPFPQDDLGVDWGEQAYRYVQRLSATQHTDGSWGSDARLSYTPDRIITTLVALAALDSRRLLDTARVEDAIHYLRRELPSSLSIPESRKTIAFDALVIELLEDLRRRGRDVVPPASLDTFVKLRNTKLVAKLRSINERHGTIHSVLDAVGGAVTDWEAVSWMQEPDGSMGIYPSSTAALLSHLPRGAPAFERGIRYLRGAKDAQGAFPPFSPSAEFERWWVLLSLAQSPLASQINLPPSRLSDIPEEGISVAATFNLPDVDTSSMKATTLLTLGTPVSVAFMRRFYRGGVFECYEHENRTSPSANVHALMTIVAAAEMNAREVPAACVDLLQGALGYLLEDLGDGDHFRDKWHLSDLYTTSHAAELFAVLLDLRVIKDNVKLREHISRKMIDITNYILGRQGADGGFGTDALSTVEETGYAARALSIAAHRGACSAPTGALLRAAGFLRSRSCQDDPPMWLGKTLYRSPLITRAQQLSALAWIDLAIRDSGAPAH